MREFPYSTCFYHKQQRIDIVTGTQYLEVDFLPFSVGGYTTGERCLPRELTLYRGIKDFILFLKTIKSQEPYASMNLIVGYTNRVLGRMLVKRFGAHYANYQTEAEAQQNTNSVVRVFGLIDELGEKIPEMEAYMECLHRRIVRQKRSRFKNK